MPKCLCADLYAKMFVQFCMPSLAENSPAGGGLGSATAGKTPNPERQIAPVPPQSVQKGTDFRPWGVQRLEITFRVVFSQAGVQLLF